MALREALDRWGFAALLTEVMVELVPERLPQEEIFEVMRNGLAHLAMDKDAANIVILGLFRVLASLGYIMDLSSCSQCQQPLNTIGRYWLNLARGHLLCERHEARARAYFSVDLGTLALLRRARHVEPDQLWRLRVRIGSQAHCWRDCWKWCGFNWEKN